MKRKQLNNKAREVPWLAIPHRYCSGNSVGYLNRSIVSIPWRNFILIFIIAYGNL